MDKIKLIEELEQHHHNFLNKEGCEHFLKPFEIDFKFQKVRANPQDFKGLSLWDKKGNPVNEMEGLSGLEISSLIADKLNISVASYYGRGFQHRANCEAIIKKLEGTKKWKS